jgi:hypothetical protein
MKARRLRVFSATGLGLSLALSASASLLGGCKPESTANNKVPSVTLDAIPGHDSLAQDTSHKESPRMVPAEAYMRTYLVLFGGMTALQAQTQLTAGGSALFDNWASYLGALGLPNYTLELPRKEETNALMIATFERLGIALCDKAIEKDLKGSPLIPIGQRLIFDFDVPATVLDEAGFAPRFEQLHRRFLGYPVKLAPTDRQARYFAVYQETVKSHPATGSRFKAVEAGWAAVCQGLIRHPEFHLY